MQKDATARQNGRNGTKINERRDCMECGAKKLYEYG